MARRSLRPPAEYSGVQRGSWYAGVFVGFVLVSIGAGAILGLTISAIHWTMLD